MSGLGLGRDMLVLTHASIVPHSADLLCNLLEAKTALAMRVVMYMLYVYVVLGIYTYPGSSHARMKTASLSESRVEFLCGMAPTRNICKCRKTSPQIR